MTGVIEVPPDGYLIRKVALRERERDDALRELADAKAKLTEIREACLAAFVNLTGTSDEELTGYGLVVQVEDINDILTGSDYPYTRVFSTALWAAQDRIRELEFQNGALRRGYEPTTKLIDTYRQLVMDTPKDQDLLRRVTETASRTLALAHAELGDAKPVGAHTS